MVFLNWFPAMGMTMLGPTEAALTGEVKEERDVMMKLLCDAGTVP